MEANKIREKYRNIILLAVIILLTGIGVTDYIYNKVVYSHIKNYCENYLDEATHNSNELFLSLSLAKGTLAVIEGSSVNVSFVAGMEVEVGDVVQPIYDAVDIAWDASLMSVISLHVQRLFLELFKMELLRLLLVIALILYMVFLLLPKSLIDLKNLLWRFSRFVIILATCIYFVFPLGMLATSAVAKYLDINHKQPSYINLNEELSKLNTFGKMIEDINQQKNDTPTSWYDIKSLSESMGSKWNTFKEAFVSLPSVISNSSGPIFEAVGKIVTIYLIEVVFLPILFLLIFWNMIKVFIGTPRIKRNRKLI